MEFVTVGVIAVVAFVVALGIAAQLPITLSKWATDAQHSGDEKKAEFWFSLALKIARKTDSYTPGGLPRSLTPLAHVMHGYSIFLFQIGKYEKSFTLDEERLALLEEANDYAHAAAAASALAVGYMMQDRIEHALDLAERCPKILTAALRTSSSEDADSIAKMQQKVYAAELLSSMFSQAWILEVLQRYDDALPLRRQAVAIAEEQFGVNHPYITPHLNRLGNLGLLRKDLELAEEPLRRCLAIREENEKEPTLVASARQAMGEFYLIKGDIESGRALIEKAYNSVKDVIAPSNPALGEFETTLAKLHLAQRRYDEAELDLKNALDRFTNAFGENNPLLLEALELLRDVYREAGRIDDLNRIQEKVQRIQNRCGIKTQQRESTI
jgi:tetratricopeptide (TPR) repeat protein